MSRTNILDTMRQIIKLLENKKEYSIKSIAYKINSKWETTLKGLEFLKEVGVVKEKSGDTRYRTERLFSLK
jgi:predicted transcriptional regulator